MSSDRLVHDPDAIAALSVTVVERTGVPAEHIEKDFWATDVGFKGDTSLSKAFSLIKRFSKDVDVLVVLAPHDSTGRATGPQGARRRGGRCDDARTCRRAGSDLQGRETRRPVPLPA